MTLMMQKENVLESEDDKIANYKVSREYLFTAQSLLQVSDSHKIYNKLAD